MHRADLLRQVADEIEGDHQYRTIERPQSYIRDELRRFVPDYNNVDYNPLDSTYKCVYKSDLEDYLVHDWTNQKEYIKQEWDCENFAFRLKANADAHGFNNIGLVIDYSSSHAYNIAVFGGPQNPVLIEPQNDDFRQPGDDDMHKLERGEILL